jgi:hypothetical protein
VRHKVGDAFDETKDRSLSAIERRVVLFLAHAVLKETR